jgi:hypothetical protein
MEYGRHGKIGQNVHQRAILEFIKDIEGVKDKTQINVLEISLRQKSVSKWHAQVFYRFVRFIPQQTVHILKVCPLIIQCFKVEMVDKKIIFTYFKE